MTRKKKSGALTTPTLPTCLLTLLRSCLTRCAHYATAGDAHCGKRAVPRSLSPPLQRQRAWRACLTFTALLCIATAAYLVRAAAWRAVAVDICLQASKPRGLYAWLSAQANRALWATAAISDKNMDVRTENKTCGKRQGRR